MQQNQTILRLPAVQQKTGLSRSTIYRLEAEGNFPSRIKLGNSTGWYEHELNTFLASLPRAGKAGVAK